LKAKRLISLALAMLMALSLMVGCQKSGSGSTASTTASGTGTESKSAVPAGDPVKISIGSTYQMQTSPCNWYETDVWKEIQKRANVTIDTFVYYDQDKFNILLSGNDFPDVVFSWYQNKLQDIMDGGLALNLVPYFNTYTNLNNDTYKQRNNIIRSYCGNSDSEQYFVVGNMGVELTDGGTDSLRGYNARWDWYKEIGTPAIKDSDDYIAALEKMVAKHPTTADGKKVYATGLDGSVFSEWYQNAAFVKPALLNIWTIADSLYMQAYDDGKLYDGYTDTSRSAFWNDMMFYNKLYKKGLLDPDSFTMTAEQRQAKSSAGQYAAEMGWPNGELYTAESAKDPNTLAGMIVLPVEANMVYGNLYHPAGYFPTYAIWVSAKTQAAEGALSFLNILQDTDVNRIQMSGVEGVNWKVVNGVPTPTDDTIKARVENGDTWKKIGCGAGNFTMLQGSFLADDGYPLDLFDTDATRKAGLNPLEKDYADYYKVDYPAQACMKLVEEGKTIDLSEFMEILYAFIDIPSTDTKRIFSQCNDICFAAVPQLVQAKSDEEFKQIQDQVLTDLKNAGEGDAWAWAQDTYNKAAEKSKDIKLPTKK